MSIYNFDPDDAYRFAREQSVTTRVRGKQLQFQVCPYCQSRNDRWTFAISLVDGAFNCKRATCGAKGNMITIARDFGFSIGRDADEYYQPQRGYRSLRKYSLPESKDGAVRYMESRGISRAITEKYNITTYQDNDGIITFPFADEDGTMQFIKYRNTNPKEGQSKEWCLKDCRPILFGMNHCDPDNSGMLVMTEGQIDSLSVAEAFGGDINAVSVPTGAKGFTWVPYCWDFLGKYKTLVVFGDYERGKITLVDEMRTRFHGTVKHVRPEDYKDCKDANELLQKHGAQAVIDAVNNAVPVKNPKILSLSDVRKEDVSKLKKIETGFGHFDQLIGGLYFGQLVILTGERGLGKSTLGSQIVTMAINQDCTAFCYSGELVDWMFRDWIDRQAAGPRAINAAKAENGYITYQLDRECADRVAEWYREKCFWYDNSLTEGTGNVSEEETLVETLETAIKQYGCQMLLIDNLMTAVEDDAKSDIYRQQTEFVKKLAFMAKRFNVVILLVVHPRKTITNEFRNDDVSGSANITNLADVVIRYALPRQDGPEQPDYDRILQVTKNRLSGRLILNGIPLYFDEASKRISERNSFGWRLRWELPVVSKDSFDPADAFDEEIPF